MIFILKYNKFDFKKLFITFFFFSLSFSSTSQTNSYDRYWYFAPNTGFDWINGAPVLVGTSSANNVEGCVVQNNENGNLLFYGGDDKIYDSSHFLMQNGTGIISQTPKQGPISIQDPNNLNEYYYIYPHSGSGAHLRYSKIDITANGGLGKVKDLEKNIIWRDSTAEGILGLRKANVCNEYWIISHGGWNNEFYVDELDDTGFKNNNPQNIGPSIIGLGGYMDYAPTSGKLAMLYGSENVAIFDFDDDNGVISNFVNVPLYDVPFTSEYYSLAFSPNGTKLYVGGGYGQNWLLQIDLSNSNYVTPIDTGNSSGGNTLKLGPDGKIYGQILFTPWTGIINDPDEPGLTCNWVPNQINTGITFSDQGFPSVGLGSKKKDTVFLGNDTTLCIGDSLTLNAGLTNATYLWSDGSTDSILNVTQPGTYWVQVSRCGTTTDTINITYTTQSSIDLGNDTTICEGDTLTLNVSTANALYLWSNNSTDSVLNIIGPDTYWVQIFNCGITTDTIIVNFKPLPSINLGNDTTLCLNDFLNLNAAYTNATHLWSDGSMDSILNVNQSGMYWVQNSLNECFSSDTIIINYDSIPKFDLGNDTSICDGEVLILDPQLLNATYLWSDNSTDSVFVINNKGKYSVVINTFCGTIIDSIFIDIESCLCNVFFPNSFSPNSDGMNDSFSPSFNCAFEQYNLSIFNRFGEKIFETNTPMEKWDGTYKKKLSPKGIYTYNLIYKLKNNIEEIRKVEHVTLIR